jgi:SAM-dependent methyltransferase
LEDRLPKTQQFISGKGENMNRWREAQKFEYNDWANVPNIVDDEWQELVKKFSAIFPKIAKKIKLNDLDRVLDLGCGPTVPSRLFGQGKITGLEPLAKKLNLTNKNAIPGVKIIEGKGEKMPFKDSTFKLVVCRNVIDHTQNPKKVINEVKRVLKKDGFFILICYTYSPFISFIKNLSEKIGKFNNVGHPFTYTPRSLEELVSERFIIVDRYTIHTGLNSTDYGKVGKPIIDHSQLHRALIFINNKVLRYPWFLKEYGFLCIPDDSYEL